MKPVLAFARKLTLLPDGLSQADPDAVLAAGWEERALYHAAAVTALFNFMNRLVEGLGIELEPSYVGAASQRLAERGYLPLLDLGIRDEQYPVGSAAFGVPRPIIYVLDKNGTIRLRYMEPTYRTRPDLEVVLRDAAALML